MRYRPTPRRALLVASLVAFACGANGANGGDASLDGGFEGGIPFIAESSDFTGFRSWHSIAITSDLAPGDSHINGPRHVFINHIPPPGSTAFPVGTVIVKETDPGPLTQRTVFASVKRGGGYDPTGDVNWEWFSLQNLANGTESILWRGPGPSSGGVYGNGALGGCNSCHGAAKATDYVFTPQLEAMIAPASDAAPPTE
jgi:hypothetical protein